MDQSGSSKSEDAVRMTSSYNPATFFAHTLRAVRPAVLTNQTQFLTLAEVRRSQLSGTYTQSVSELREKLRDVMDLQIGDRGKGTVARSAGWHEDESCRAWSGLSQLLLLLLPITLLLGYYRYQIFIVFRYQIVIDGIIICSDLLLLLFYIYLRLWKSYYFQVVISLMNWKYKIKPII